jgi:hypothetical protein
VRERIPIAGRDPGGAPAGIRGPSLSRPDVALASTIGNRAMARLAACERPRSSGSRALALRQSLRTTTPPRRQLARDLTKKHYVWHGNFQMNMKTQSNPGANSGLMGAIEFRPDPITPDSNRIRLFQAVRLEDVTTGKEYVWTGGEAPRVNTQTAADAKKGIDPGWFIDHSAAAAAKRTKKADPKVSAFYRDYWPNAGQSHDGFKKGTATKTASLWDFPQWSQKCRFSFETVAVAVDNGMVYGTVQWGFTISDGAKGTITNEYSRGRGAPTATTWAALKAFDEYYANPGASTAPKK